MTIRSRSERRTGAVYNVLETGHCFNHASKNTFGRDCLREKIDFTPILPQIFVDYYYLVYLIGRLKFRVREGPMRAQGASRLHALRRGR
jgi:hypothetical protein